MIAGGWAAHPGTTAASSTPLRSSTPNEVMQGHLQKPSYHRTPMAELPSLTSDNSANSEHAHATNNTERLRRPPVFYLDPFTGAATGNLRESMGSIDVRSSSAKASPFVSVLNSPNAPSRRGTSNVVSTTNQNQLRGFAVPASMYATSRASEGSVVMDVQSFHGGSGGHGGAGTGGGATVVMRSSGRSSPASIATDAATSRYITTLEQQVGRLSAQCGDLGTTLCAVAVVKDGLAVALQESVQRQTLMESEADQFRSLLWAFLHTTAVRRDGARRMAQAEQQQQLEQREAKLQVADSTAASLREEVARLRHELESAHVSERAMMLSPLLQRGGASFPAPSGVEAQAPTATTPPQPTTTASATHRSAADTAAYTLVRRLSDHLHQCWDLYNFILDKKQLMMSYEEHLSALALQQRMERATSDLQQHHARDVAKVEENQRALERELREVRLALQQANEREAAATLALREAAAHAHTDTHGCTNHSSQPTSATSKSLPAPLSTPTAAPRPAVVVVASPATSSILGAQPSNNNTMKTTTSNHTATPSASTTAAAPIRAFKPVVASSDDDDDGSYQSHSVEIKVGRLMCEPARELGSGGSVGRSAEMVATSGTLSGTKIKQVVLNASKSSLLSSSSSSLFSEEEVPTTTTSKKKKRRKRRESQQQRPVVVARVEDNSFDAEDSAGEATPARPVGANTTATASAPKLARQSSFDDADDSPVKVANPRAAPTPAPRVQPAAITVVPTNTVKTNISTNAKVVVPSTTNNASAAVKPKTSSLSSKLPSW